MVRTVRNTRPRTIARQTFLVGVVVLTIAAGALDTDGTTMPHATQSAPDIGSRPGAETAP